MCVWHLTNWCKIFSKPWNKMPLNRHTTSGCSHLPHWSAISCFAHLCDKQTPLRQGMEERGKAAVERFLITLAVCLISYRKSLWVTQYPEKDAGCWWAESCTGASAGKRAACKSITTQTGHILNLQLTQAFKLKHLQRIETLWPSYMWLNRNKPVT